MPPFSWPVPASSRVNPLLQGYHHPVYHQPVYRRPVHHQPVYRRPVHHQRVYRHPVHHQLVYHNRCITTLSLIHI